jgi:hypothetical protein
MAPHECRDLAALYEAYFQAERAWEKALAVEFADCGVDVNRARYDSRGRGLPGSDLAKAYAAHRAAQEAYFGELRARMARPAYAA